MFSDREKRNDDKIETHLDYLVQMAETARTHMTDTENQWSSSFEAIFDAAVELAEAINDEENLNEG